MLFRSIYLCSCCLYCAHLVPQLHRAITEGALKGIARAYVREFPVRSHADSTDSGLATVAARRLGKGWAYLLHLYKNAGTFDVSKLATYAAEVGIDEQAFRSQLADPSVRQQLVASKREGVRNRVAATPTLFINNRLYSGPLDIDSIIDVIQEEAERVKARSKK